MLKTAVLPIAELEEMVNFGTLFAFVLVSAGVVILRRTLPNLQQGFRVSWASLLNDRIDLCLSLADAELDCS